MRNVIVLAWSTLFYALLFVSGVGRWVGGINLPLSLFVFSVVIPFVFGYFTRKYLTGNSTWISAATLLIPVIPNTAILIYDQIKTGWGPMDVPLSATLGFIVVQGVFAVFGAYVCIKKNSPIPRQSSPQK